MTNLSEEQLCSDHELMQLQAALEFKIFDWLKLTPFDSGALPLFGRGFFPWGALPYPKEHAELGKLLLETQKSSFEQMARAMAHFQSATLDHRQVPFTALFEQEGRWSKKTIEEACAAFLEAAQLPFVCNQRFCDAQLGMVSRRSESSSLILLGSGCKSGMGAFLHEGGGVINFGPQLVPTGNLSGFGLAGRGQDIELEDSEEGFRFRACCSLAAPSKRYVEPFRLWDSGCCGMWIKADSAGSLEHIELKLHLEGYRPLSAYCFSFFGKGEKALIAGSHHLSPRSLDRYSGPAQPLLFWGAGGGVTVHALDGVAHMEVVPLAGDESFWGADFLATYSLKAPDIRFLLTASAH